MAEANQNINGIDPVFPESIQGQRLHVAASEGLAIWRLESTANRRSHPVGSSNDFGERRLGHGLGVSIDGGGQCRDPLRSW
jgi:hypothetical protein